MAKLKEGQALERELRVHGIDWPVIVRISQEGVTVRLKGQKTSLTNNWVQLIDKGLLTPANVPSFLMGKPYEFLQQIAVKLAKKKTDKYIKKAS